MVEEVTVHLLPWVWILSSPTIRGERIIHEEAQEEVVGLGATAVGAVAVVRLVIQEEDRRGRHKIRILVVVDRLEDLKGLHMATRWVEEEGRLEIRILPNIPRRRRDPGQKTRNGRRRIKSK